MLPRPVLSFLFNAYLFVVGAVGPVQFLVQDVKAFAGVYKLLEHFGPFGFVGGIEEYPHQLIHLHPDFCFQPFQSGTLHQILLDL